MASLTDVDISLKLPGDAASERLERAQKRLLALRLQCGGLIGDGKLGPPLLILLERFAAKAEWQRAYGEIVDFERSLAAEGAVIVKFWMHISAHEQLKRFKAREKDPLRAWKLTGDDWRNRDKRHAYERAVEDMLTETDRRAARWSLIAGEDKGYARVAVIEAVIAALERGLRDAGQEPVQTAAEL